MQSYSGIRETIIVQRRSHSELITKGAEYMFFIITTCGCNFITTTGNVFQESAWNCACWVFFRLRCVKWRVMTQPADLWWGSRWWLVSNSQTSQGCSGIKAAFSAPLCGVRVTHYYRLSPFLQPHKLSFMFPCHTSLRLRFQWGCVQKHLGPNSHSACRLQLHPSLRTSFHVSCPGRILRTTTALPWGVVSCLSNTHMLV